jgi:hypothetical protein
VAKGRLGLDVVVASSNVGSSRCSNKSRRHRSLARPVTRSTIRPFAGFSLHSEKRPALGISRASYDALDVGRSSSEECSRRS